MASDETQSATARRMYNARSSYYNDSWHPSFAQWMADTASLKPGERVLDLACGTGLLTFAAANAVGPSGNVTGIDISDGMLAEAAARLEKEKDKFKNVQFFNHDVAHLSSLDTVKEECFDAITCASALVLLRDPKAALQEWHKYLKPGGRLVVDTTHPSNLPSGIAWEKVYLRLGQTPFHSRLWSQNEETFKSLLQSIGYDIANTRILFKPQVGFGRRHHSIAEGEEIFNKEIQQESNRPLRDLGLISKAKELFLEEWASVANSSGQILEIDGVFVAVAKKALTTPAPKPLLTGSCACGAITWISTSAPKLSNNCHCETCRKISGSPYITFLHLPTSDISFTPFLSSPQVKTYTASPHAERTFCRDCGSTLTFKYHLMPDIIGVAIGTVDEGKSSASLKGIGKKHIWVSGKPEWYNVPEDGLERQDRMEGVEKLIGEE
jgi:ubiquinone/menaquinone biosynthesis C-methylase UbiE